MSYELVTLTWETSVQVQGRKVSNKELADLPERWENPTVDVSKYVQCAMEAWEVSFHGYEIWKAAGGLCQQHEGKYYIA